MFMITAKAQINQTTAKQFRLLASKHLTVVKTHKTLINKIPCRFNQQISPIKFHFYLTYRLIPKILINLNIKELTKQVLLQQFSYYKQVKIVQHLKKYKTNSIRHIIICSFQKKYQTISSNTPIMTSFKKTQSNVYEKDQKVLHAIQSIQNLQEEEKSRKKTVQMEQIYVMDQLKENQPKQIHTATLKHRISQERGDQVWTEFEKRQKMPASLKFSLRKKAQESGGFRQKRQQTQKKSRFGDMISSKLKKEQIACGICLGVMKQIDIVNLSKCQHVFCKNCTRDYVTYKIKMFEQVVCPDQTCNILMNQQTQFFGNLAPQLKKQYLKIHQFYTTANDPSLKLCPKQDCQGVIKIIESQSRICNLCKRQFCAKCYFQKHQGNCDQNQIDFLENNMHFRQCSNCKFVVERSEGCNHMTCKCKYEFCYLCGKQWTGYDHICNQNQQPAQGLLQQGGCLDCCDCCDDVCGGFCGMLIKLPLRLLLCLMLLVVFAMVFANSLMMLTLYLLASIIAGIFGYSTDFICTLCDQEKQCKALLCLIFFPIPMIIGLYKAFTQMFMQLAEQQINQLRELISTGCRSIWS